MSAVHLGVSTCPNDTFLVHALAVGAVDTLGLEFRIELADVEVLNQRLFAGDFDVAKASFAAALRLGASAWVLSTGSALGRGVGPLLLAAREGTHPSMPAPAGRAWSVLAPGEHTTATLLYRLFHGRAAPPEQVVFSEVLPALEAGRADFGICIHEGRFTWRGRGLSLVEDLGERWEREVGMPLPLGGLVARRTLGEERARRVQAVLRASLEYGLAHPRETFATMRRHAQELDDAVIAAHVELYVNDSTLCLGSDGREALAELAARAARAGLVPPSGTALEVLAG